MKNNDVELIRRVLEGDDNAFSVLVRKYQKQVHALAWRKIGDFHIAEEITQDTFLKAYKRLATLKKPQRFVSWLYVIAANRCSSWLRKKRVWTQPLEQLKETDNEQLQKSTYSGFVIAENERTTIDAQRDVVKKLLAKLQESERTVITLHYFGEMSCTEIGEFLGVSANTIKSRLRRAQQRLKKEESMIREALENFQITPNLTENIMREIARIKPATPSSGKPFTPWAIAASTVAVVLLMLGIGNHQYAIRFQQPYSFDATSEMTVELIDAPVLLNLASKTDVRTQLRNADALSKNNKNLEHPSDDAPALVTEAQADESVNDYSQWALPKEAKARLGKGGINVLQFSPDGTQLAVGSNIGVWLYDVETGEEISLFAGMCQSLSFSPDGRFLANGGGLYRTTDIQVWDTTTGHKVALVDPPASASTLRFSADGKRLISLSSWGDTIHRLDIETGRENGKHLEARQSDSEERYSEAHAITHDKVAIGGWDGKIQLWDITTGEKLSSLRGHADLPDHPSDTPLRLPSLNRNQVLALAFSPDGKRLASGGKDNTVRLWGTTSDNEPIVLQKHTGWTNVLAFSPDGKILASGSTDKTVQLWNTDTGAPIVTLTGHLNGINALAFSPDGTTLASGSTDGTIRFWSIETRDALATPITGHTEWVKGVTLLNDSATLASVAFNGAITFWDVKTSQKTTHQITGHRDWLATLAFSPDGTQLASIGADSTMVVGFGSVTKPDSLIRLTDVSTGHEVATLNDKKGVSNLVFSPDGKMVAFGNHDEIRLWNTETGSTLDISLPDQNDVQKIPYNAHENGVLVVPPGLMPHQKPQISALTFSPDGTRLASATMEGNVHMWDAETGIGLVSLTAQDPSNVKYGVKEAAEADSDATIVATTSPNATVVTTYKDPISALAFSPNGKLLAAGSRQQIRLWNMETGNWGGEISAINSYKDGREVFHGTEALVFSPDNTVLVNGDGNGRIQLWDMTTGNELVTLNGHMEGVETLKFSPDGKTLVSAGQDGTILLWDWDEIMNGLSKGNK